MKKIIDVTAFLVAAIGFGLSTQQLSVHASRTAIPKNYSFDIAKIDSMAIPYYSVNTNKNAYIWNDQHTKRIHNLKHYPNTVWMVYKANIRRINGKRAIYYKAESAYNSKITGLIYSGYLNKNIAKAPVLFKTDDQYSNYINTDRSQIIAKKIAKLFPNSKISLELSKHSENANNPVINFEEPIYLTKQLNPFSLMSKTPTQIINLVKAKLEHQGYNAQKRAALKDYSIGLNVAINVEYIETEPILRAVSNSIYPQNYGQYYDDNSSGTISLSIAKSK